MPRILIIEDDAALGAAFALAVRRCGHLPTLAASGGVGLAKLQADSYDAVILDIGLPDMSGLQVLETLRARDAQLPVVVVTAHATLDHAISAQKLGATHYLPKPFDLAQLEQTLAAALPSPQVAAPRSLAKTLAAKAGLMTDNGAVAAAAAATATAGATLPAAELTLIGDAPCLQPVFIGIGRACAADTPVLLTGPSGAGKTLAARIIHAQSPRAAAPLHSLTATPVVDEARLAAALRDAATATLLLEDIAQLSPTAQAYLAHWLGQAHAGGASQRPRLIATLTGDPRQAMTVGTLRPELFYTIGTLSIALPCLAERSGDIPALVRHFAHQVLPAATLAALQAHAWPGNVRELRHALDHALALARGAQLLPSHLPQPITASATGLATDAAPISRELDAALARWLDQQLSHGAGSAALSYDALLERVESIMLTHLLAKHDHKPTHLATCMNLNRATLRQKLRRLGLSE